MKRGLAFLLAVAVPLGAFTWQSQLGAFSDDSVSYLTLANFFSPSGNPLAAQWAGYDANFPPLWPLALAFSGGVHDLRIAHALIAAFAAIGTALFYRYAAREAGERPGLAVAVLFLATATAWVSLKGVLSEALFLLLAMTALLFHERRLASGRAPARDWLLFGAILAGVVLTRTIGVAFLAAYAAHVAVRWVTRRERPALAALLPAIPVILLAGLWYGLRPNAESDNYQRLFSDVASWWSADPLGLLVAASQFFFLGWIRSFMADHYISLTPRIALAVVGLAALGGLALRLARNRLDAWFVLFSLLVTFSWAFGPDASRRLLYPFIPLLLLCAADFVLAICRMGNLEAGPRRLMLGGACLFLLALDAPALVLIAKKAMDTRPVVAGCPHVYREVASYYGIIEQPAAEKLSQLEVAMLCGFTSLAQRTPAGSTVMWTRPQYIAVLGDRRGAPYLYAWSPRELAHQIRRRDVDYVIVAQYYKNDLHGGRGRLVKDMQLENYSSPAYAVGDGVFTAYRIDKARLARLPD